MRLALATRTGHRRGAAPAGSLTSVPARAHRRAGPPYRARGRAPGGAQRDAQVRAWARAQASAVARADSSWAVTLTGPAPTLARLLGTSLAHGRASSALSVPAALRGAVASVHGLDDRPVMRARAVPYGLTGPALRSKA